MKRISSNQELIQSVFLLREIESFRNLNFSSNHKIDVTIIFQTREINEKNFFKPGIKMCFFSEKSRVPEI